MAQDILGMHGIRVTGDGLAIAVKHNELKRMFSGTNYQAGYAEVLKRHKLCTLSKPKQVRMADTRFQSIIFDWHQFKADYLDGSNELPEAPPF